MQFCLYRSHRSAELQIAFGPRQFCRPFNLLVFCGQACQCYFAQASRDGLAPAASGPLARAAPAGHAAQRKSLETVSTGDPLTRLLFYCLKKNVAQQKQTRLAHRICPQSTNCVSKKDAKRLPVPHHSSRGRRRTESGMRQLEDHNLHSVGEEQGDFQEDSTTFKFP